MKSFTKLEKISLIKKVPYWWHAIDLGDNIVTPGFTAPWVHKLLSSAIPKNLKGKTVLDIGAWDGYYSFECEKRGAKVTAIDNYQNRKGRKGFNTAKRIIGSKVKYRQMDLFDLPEWKKKFDVIIFFGVLYHVKHPLKALEIIFSKTKKLLILESHYIKRPANIPIMRFYPGKELSNDPTNWWGPNIMCIIDMLKVVGFKKIKLFATYLNKKERGRVIIKAYKK